MATVTIGSGRPLRAEQARSARWPRFVAATLDIIIFGFIGLTINSVFGITQVTGRSASSVSFETAVSPLWLALAAIVYFALPEGLFGASVGKLMVGLRVVRVDGKTLGLREVIIRNLVRVVDGLPAFNLIGGVSVLVTRNSQRIGDLVAGTTVVRKENAQEPGETRTSGRLALRMAGLGVAALMLFTLAFNYFARPPMVIAGAFNQGAIMGRADSYTLGKPQWSLGTITYPMAIRGAPNNYGGKDNCTGTITLEFMVVGWGNSRSEFTCGG